jgi:hypothetical protein
MAQCSDRRRKPRQKLASNTELLWVTLHDVPGTTGEIRAKVIDMSEGGIGVEAPCALQRSEFILVQGLPGSAGQNAKVRVQVRWCQRTSEGFLAGLAYQESRERKDEAVPDYYEVLQISPSADPDIIHRVYRLLAQRYHPDNAAGGDEGAFRKISEAYRALGDPEKRAAYDIHLHTYRQIRWRIFDQKQALSSKLAERGKRRGILDLLYSARRQQPHQPAVTIQELEDLLGCPREHLEFSIWYLKENALVARGDNGRLTITAKGVDWAEKAEEAETRSERKLPPASGPPTRPAM